MRKMATIAAAALGLAAFGAPIPQASQAWVEMKITQAKSELMAYIDAGLSNTNMTQSQVADNAASISVANMMPLASLFSSPDTYTPNPTGVVSYIILGASSAYTNALRNGIRLTQKTAYTYGTNDILLAIGTLTNTLTFSTFELAAPKDGVYFTDGADGWAFITEVKE